jgi:dihydroorotate dehydrogenase
MERLDAFQPPRFPLFTGPLGYLRPAMYQLLRSLLFRLPAETAHYLSMNALKALCAVPPFRALLTRLFHPHRPLLRRSLFGLSFRNPVGLGAGFDKNARYLRELDVLGFGFVEIGTVTPRPQYGNEKPRLFRLPLDGALINRMGFNNEGVDAAARRLKAWRQRYGKRSTLLVGGNIGKNKDTPNEEAWKDYEICFRALHPHVDFFIVNVSSPNTPGLRALQERDVLYTLLTRLQAMNRQFAIQKPILLKIAPDLTASQIEEVIALAGEIGLDGLVASNTTISREGLKTPASLLEQVGAGGLSGRPLRKRSTDVVRLVHTASGGKLPVIGSGGIFTGADAKEKLEAGASLVELWTGFIYEGPFIVKRICRALD